MKWSKYNYILNCKHGVFVYNSTTNSFLKISLPLLDTFKNMKEGNIKIDELNEDIKKILITHNILVSNDFDDKYLTKLKYTHSRSAFANSQLSLTIATTTNCNFRCPYCYEAGISHTKMDEETETAIIDYINSIKPRTLDITWYGGEPLMNFKTIERLTDKINELSYIENLKYDIITNGSLLTEKVRSYFVGKKLKNVQITIDGLEENHNRTRITKNGKSSYHIILNNLDKALEILPDCHFSVRVNIGLNNRDDYPLLYHKLRERYEAKTNFSIYFSFVEDYSMCGGASCLNSKDRIDFLRYLQNEHHIAEEVYPRRQQCLCIANTINNFVIAPNGDLYKCWNEIGRKDYIVGNIKNKKIITNYDLICDYSINYNKFNDPKCLECFLLPVCIGGCPSNRYSNLTKNTNLEICPYNFEHIDLTLELMYERIVAATKKYLSKDTVQK